MEYADSHEELKSGRIYTLGELIDAPALINLCESFERLGNCRIAITGADGERLDVESGTDPDSTSLDERFGVDVRWKHHLLGRVVVVDADPNEHQRELVAVIAEILAGVCQGEARIRKRVSELTAVYDLGGLFAGTDKLDTILQVASVRVCEVMNVKAASIRVLDPTGTTLRIAAEHNLSEQYLAKGPIEVKDNLIDAQALAGEVVYIADARTDPRVRFPEHAKREGIVSGLCCRMRYRGHNVGVMRIYTAKQQRFSRFDIELLRAVASQAAGAIVHSRLYRDAVAAHEFDRQLKRAGMIQRRMLPAEPPEHPRIEFGHVYMPSLAVGGDFFDYLELPEGNWGVAIADIAGKGITSALMMASVRSALRAHARSIYNIKEIIAQVNEHMCRDTRVSEFATLLYGVFSPDGRRFTYCNAGHNPGLLFRGKRIEHLEAGGMVIGVDSDTTFDQGIVHLKPDDLLVLYTDGVTEALNYDEQLFGYDRLIESVKRYRNEPAPILANQILWDVRRFAGLMEQSDDISVVVARVRGPVRS